MTAGIEVRSAESRRYQRLRQRQLAKRAGSLIGVPAEVAPRGAISLPDTDREKWKPPCHGNPNLCGSRDRQQREFLARNGLCCADHLEAAS